VGTKIGTWTILNFLKEPETDVLHPSQESPNIDDATLQNFIYKHTQDLENVQRNREKGECTHDVKLAQTKCRNLSMSKNDWFEQFWAYWEDN
jgi:hypothetical protein